MRSRALGAVVLALLASASCERIAGLHGKTFDVGGDRVMGGTGGSGGTGAETGGSGLIGGAAGQDDGEGAESGASGAGGAGGTSASGGTGNRAGEGNDDGGSGGGLDDCEDVTQKLCMQPLWSTGVVPYRLDGEWPEFARRMAHGAVGYWDGLLGGSIELAFAERDVEGVPTLVFSLDEGCGPIGVTEDAVRLGLESCTETLEMARAVGVALGLPRMHQRTDRDRYLQLTDPERFDCRKSQIYEKCPTRGDMPAQLGPFDFRSIMFAPYVDFEVCVSGAFESLYLPRVMLSDPPLYCDWVSRNWFDGFVEQSELAELYAIAEGWRPTLPIGIDEGSIKPLRFDIQYGVYDKAERSLVAFDAPRIPRLAIFAIGGPSEDPLDLNAHVWMRTSNDGDTWSMSYEELPIPPIPPYLGYFWASRRGRTQAVDFFYLMAPSAEVEQLLYYASYDLETSVASDWVGLNAPSSGAWFPIAQASEPAGKTILYTQGTNDSNRTFEMVELELGAPVNTTHSVPELSTTEPFGSVFATVGESGERHVVGRTATSLRYAHRDLSGDWAAWIDLADFPPLAFVSALTSTEHHPLAIVGEENDAEWDFSGRIWFHACTGPSCIEPSAWSEPLQLDIVEPSLRTPLYVRGVVSTDHHEVGIVASCAGYLWFVACAEGPCDRREAWSQPIVISGETQGKIQVVSSADRIDIAMTLHEDRIGEPTILGSFHKRWRTESLRP